MVMGTSTNPERRPRLKDFGCDLALDSSDPTWPEQVKQATGGKGVDAIVDQVSARPTSSGTHLGGRPKGTTMFSALLYDASC